MDFQMDAANSTSSSPRKREPMDVAFPPESLWIPAFAGMTGEGPWRLSARPHGRAP